MGVLQCVSFICPAEWLWKDSVEKQTNNLVNMLAVIPTASGKVALVWQNPSRKSTVLRERERGQVCTGQEGKAPQTKRNYNKIIRESRQPVRNCLFRVLSCLLQSSCKNHLALEMILQKRYGCSQRELLRSWVRYRILKLLHTWLHNCLHMLTEYSWGFFVSNIPESHSRECIFLPHITMYITHGCLSTTLHTLSPKQPECGAMWLISCDQSRRFLVMKGKFKL